MESNNFGYIKIYIIILSCFTAFAHAGPITFKQFYHYGSVQDEYTEADNASIKNGISKNLNQDSVASPEKAKIQIYGQIYSNNWMMYLDPDLAFKDLNIPGTHDTMSYISPDTICQLEESA